MPVSRHRPVGTGRSEPGTIWPTAMRLQYRDGMPASELRVAEQKLLNLSVSSITCCLVCSVVNLEQMIISCHRPNKLFFSSRLKRERLLCLLETRRRSRWSRWGRWSRRSGRSESKVSNAKLCMPKNARTLLKGHSGRTVSIRLAFCEIPFISLFGC